MSNVAISVEGLGKRYQIGTGPKEPYGSLRDSLTRAAKAPINRLRRSDWADGAARDYWALKDVSFEVKHGEAVGIIGRNGAGKSTLLKVLSRITEPTTGQAIVNGRVGSLLEVGTGFHPELTGRENIYLNGAVMGMSRADIKRRFDEIVDFAGVETYLDTPVKRYSSGMYMRLAFAVAAHLEPEVLVVDEVLAVGDSEFQKKCLGKMSAVATDGRTVLFVSHSMGAVQQLCGRCLLLSQGGLEAIGDTNTVVQQYINDKAAASLAQVRRTGNGKIQFEKFYITDENGEQRTDFFMGDTIRVNFALTFMHTVRTPEVTIEICNQFGECYAHVIDRDDAFTVGSRQEGARVQIEVDIPRVFFTPAKYLVSLWVGEDMHDPCDYLRDCLEFDLLQGSALKRKIPYPTHVKTFLESTWNVVQNT